jgi:DNA-binding MarR family transcriptional regulator
MSRPYNQIPARAAALYRRGPFVGGLLRLTYRAARHASLQMIRERGFDDLNQALLNGFFWPPPEGVRPIDLAEGANMTRQATNRMIGELEKLGYMERRANKRGGRRLVFLTGRGWKVFEAIWTAQVQLQEEWTAILGKKRFDELIISLRQLSMIDAKSKMMRARRSRSRKPHARRTKRAPSSS